MQVKVGSQAISILRTVIPDTPFAREANMLKITITETPMETRWILEGRLAGPWVSELRNAWTRTHQSQDKRTCIIDLNDVTFIDDAGERLLRTMSKEGARFIATGIYIKHVLQKSCER